MKRIISYMTTALLLLAVSCNRALPEGGTGYLSVSLERDDELILKAAETPSDDMVFSLSVYRGSELVTTVDDYRTLLSQPLELVSGKYRVVASSGTDAQAAIESPYYEGYADVTVPVSQTVSADIVCTLANVKVTASFDDAVKDAFPEYKVTVGNSSASTVVLGNLEGTADKAAYIKADGVLKWELSMKNSDGQAYLTSGQFDDVKPRQYYALNFSLEESPEGEDGAFIIRVTVDESMTEKEYDFVLDFSESNITITSNEGFDIDSEVCVPVGDASTRTLSISADKGLKSLLLAVDGVKEYELVDASSEVLLELAAAGITVPYVSSGALSASVDVTDYVKNLIVGDYSLRIYAYDMLSHYQSKEISISVMSDVEVDAVSATPWAGFVILKGKWFNKQAPEGMTFSYRKVSDTQWQSVDAGSLTIDVSSKTYTAEVYSLEPSTAYEFKAVSDAGQDTRTITFTTDAAGTVYNLSFDDWWQSGKVWYPYASDANPTVWDTANGGTSILSVFPTTPEESNVAVSGSGKKAARLESMKAAGRLAAGNIYTGKFGKATLSPVGATLEWGTEFTSRPIALKGYCDYRPVDIDVANDPYTALKGTKDVAQIQILLTDWLEPFQINTGNQVFVDPETDSGIIAYGALDVNATSGYAEFTIPLEYRSLTRTPKYIVIVGAASKYGDYFTGGVGSVLYLDEFRLVYDPAELSEDQRQQVNYRQ
ncbi:MAG: DUF4493 domain-containing protein [Candidatus Cryptobacteroides sp.]